MIKIWKNTKTLDSYDSGLNFTLNENQADIILSGSKKIVLDNFENLKAIFRCGIGKDNIPEQEAQESGILVRFPSKKTINIIFEETANFTCNLIFKMIYSDVGDLQKWIKYDRIYLGNLNLLVIGMGNIGKRVYNKMENFMNVHSFDILHQNEDELEKLIKISDCITIHIPNTIENKNFFNKDKFLLMKEKSILINTARGDIVNEGDLFEVLSKNKIKAAFDVFWNEPYNGKLKQFHPHSFYMTPHISSTCTDFLKGCREDLDNLIKEISND
tara:strand:- start:404 stop:1219 length:816 start_codon:yes stop_codon:yes gene_type:complete